MKKYIIFLVLFIASFGAFSQTWTNIYGRQRFATGLSIPVKDSTAFQGSADTSLIYVNPSNGGIYYRYKTNHIRLGTGGGGSGTVTSVAMSVPTGFSISGTPITTAGTLGLSFASGYSLPTNANQTNWTTAYTNRITSLTTTGNSGSATLISNTLNIPTYTLAGLGGITATYLSGTPPISYNSGTGVISISQATTSTNGYLSSTDWNTFNSKQNQLNGTGFVKASGTTISYDTTSYVPYINATKNVNLGEWGLSSGFIKYDITPTGTPTTQGTTYWDVNEETVALIMNGTTQRIGQDLFFPVKNQTGVTIPKGTAVRFAGTLGASGRLLIEPFLANGTYPSKYFMGVTAEDILNGDNGQVLAFGKIRKINTSAYVNGDILYASTTSAGGFQTTAPVAPNNIVSIAVVVYADNTNGEILVRPQVGSKLSDDENVLFTSLANNNVLAYDSTSTLWKNKSIPTVLGYTPVPTTRTISTTAPLAGGGDLSANRTLSITQSSGSVDGYLSAANWRTFNNKQDTLKLTTTGSSGASTYNPTTETLNVPTYTLAGLGGISLTSLSATSPLSYNNTTGAFSISQATGSTNGYLSSTDWTTFNAKQGAITLTTTGTSGAATLIGTTLNIPNYATGGITGSGANGQATFWTGTSTVSGDNGFFWDNTNKRLGLGTTTPTHILETAQDVKINSVIVGVGGGTPPLYNIKMGTTNLNNNTTGSYNIGIGIGSLAANTTGSYNIAMGLGAGGGSTAHGSNVFIGHGVATIASPSSNAVIIGNFAGSEGGIKSTIIGAGARTNTMGDSTTAIGYQAGASSDGTNNMYFGYRSGYFTHGYNNILFGHDAAYSATQKDVFNSIIIGYSAQPLASGNKNQIVIGNNATGLGSYTTTIGNDSTNHAAIRGNLLLGTTTNETTALLNMVSTSKGFLKPRMTTTQRDAITSPATGLEIFNTTTGVPNYYNGSAWTATGTGSGTVTSVAALTLGTTGTDLSSTVANGTTTPVITLNVPTASATNRGVLSSADWSTFNGKQNALSGTGFVKISGTTISYDNSTYLTTSSAASTYQPLLSLTSGYIPKATGTSTLGNSSIYDNGSGIGINTSALQTLLGVGLTIDGAGYAPLYLADSGTLRGFVAGYSGGLLISSSTGALTLNNGGNNVLIGTTTDAGYKLDVNGTLRASGAATFSSSVTASYYDGGILRVLTSSTFRGGLGTGNWAFGDGTNDMALYSENAIKFGAGSTEKMRINSTGNISIGNTNNTYKLEVTGTGYFSSTLNANSFVKIGGTSSQYLMADGSVSTLTNPVTGTGTANYLTKWSSSSAVGNSAIYDAGSNVLGIGTTSPLIATSRQGMVIRGGSTGAELVLQSTNSTNGTYDGFSMAIDADIAYLYNKRNGNLQLGANNAVKATVKTNGDFDITGAYLVNGVPISTGGITGTLASGYITKATGTSTVDNSGLYDAGSSVLGLGTTSPTLFTGRQGMVIRGSSAGAELILQSTSSTNGTYDGLSLAMDGDVAYIFNKRNGDLQLGANNARRATLTVGGDFDITGTYKVNGVALSSGIGGSGTANNMPKFATGTTLGNSLLYDDGTYVYFGNATALADNSITFNKITADAARLIFNQSAAGGTKDNLVFRLSGTTVGSITTSGSSTAYNTTSDYRLKKDFKQFDGISLVNKINVYDYAWKINDERSYGVKAHELQEIVPYAVTGIKDGENFQSVDYSKIVPILVQAIKDQQKQIDQLKSKIK